MLFDYNFIFNIFDKDIYELHFNTFSSHFTYNSTVCFYNYKAHVVVRRTHAMRCTLNYIRCGVLAVLACSVYFHNSGSHFTINSTLCL